MNQDVKCPKCGRKFFATDTLDGKIEIKCPKCKEIMVLNFMSTKCGFKDTAGMVVYTGKLHTTCGVYYGYKPDHYN